MLGATLQAHKSGAALLAASKRLKAGFTLSTKYTDRKGREWDLSLDLFKASVIDKSDFTLFWDKKFSILDLERTLIQKLLTDARFLFAVIWSMVQDQAQEKWETYQRAKAAYDKSDQVGPSTYIAKDGPFQPPADSFPTSPKESAEAELEFVSGVNGPTIEAARNAFMEALSDFFPDQRTVLSILSQQLKTMQKKASEKLVATLPLVDELLEAEMDDKVQILRDELATLVKNRGVTSTPSSGTLESASEISGPRASLYGNLP